MRAAVRASESRPLVKRIKRALQTLTASKRPLPQSQLGTALDYALGQWRTLEIYLTDGRVEIDNNLVENAIRPTAIGKNYVKLSVMRRYNAGGFAFWAFFCCGKAYEEEWRGVENRSVRKHRHDRKHIPQCPRAPTNGSQPTRHNTSGIRLGFACSRTHSHLHSVLRTDC